MEYLKGLNTEQLEAATHTEGPLLILAGAGAGKTKTVTYRILHLIKTGVDPEKILAITFTNKAAKEMRERVMNLLQSDQSLNLPLSSFGPDFARFKSVSKPFVSTFHSLAVHILKESGQHIGVSKNFVIFDRSDSKQVIKDALVELGHDPKKIEPSKIISIISREKGNFVSQEEFEAKNADEYIGSIAAEVWRKYDAALSKEKALDFDDLLFKATQLLSVNQSIREYYQQKWTHVHVDEYQDTNQVQYRLVQLIVGKRGNIAVVGDADQSIYGWRGADIKNILKFEEDYPNATTILLEQNYRSTQTILTAANKIIEKNIYRKKKNLFTKNEEGSKIKVYTAYDEGDEANFVANTVRDLVQEDKVNPDEISVLFRANFQSRALEEAFLRKNIPYTLLGTKFFERREIKDVLSYIRAALNPDSMSDIKRIINTPTRGIGKTTVLKILEGKERDLPSATLMKVQSFRQILVEIKKKTENTKPSEVIKYVLQISGLERSYKEDNDTERLENVQELVTLATKFDTEDFPLPTGVDKLLEEASLASDQDDLDKKVREKEAPEHSVKLMTVHASKGLEFDHVFITGLEQDLFPHARSVNEHVTPEQSEEERRLFYVALTRARKQLYLSHANVRTIFGSKNVTVPSEFIADLDDDLVERDEPEVVTGIKSIFIDF
ncbi:MAG: ATP-dependent DNA helicase PcrA [Candidatus Taylorbacteria bacterium]|nr:ATP-dependent DNA helicase PcrA [Candidatus Taylorbacteria bacterium]